MALEPFQIHVPDEVLEDLRERLARTRWPDELADAGWEYGTNRDELQGLVGHWLRSFDWRKQEEKLNAFPHFRARLDATNVHFIHARGRGPRPLAIVLTHGWPSTFFEMLKLVPLLTDPAAHGGDPADAFDVVVPSLPGYGFSDAPAAAGLAGDGIAALWVRLMDELGYARFGAHGGDIGAGITTRLGLRHADRLVGIHLTAVAGPYRGPGSPPVTPEEEAYLEGARRWGEEEGGYSHLQRTRPQTPAYALNDSPAGLAAWVVEKWRAWSDCGGDLERRFTRDELLTNVTLYWATGTIGSSMRLYREGRLHGRPFGPADRVTVPTGVALFPADIENPPRSWAERTYIVERWTRMPRGGHFAALEEPELLARDLREFFRPLRTRGHLDGPSAPSASS
jgi:pimeloyl-ACP methyl ester carboxylesterase